MINEQELNKKLAKWAGLNIKHDYTPIGFDNMMGCRKCGGIKPSIFKYCCLPNFTQSPDACFKWLVPKLVTNDYEIEIKVGDYGTSVVITKLGMYHGAPVIDEQYSEDNEKSTLALCLAIEKLIDSEAKK